VIPQPVPVAGSTTEQSRSKPGALVMVGITSSGTTRLASSIPSGRAAKLAIRAQSTV